MENKYLYRMNEADECHQIYVVENQSEVLFNWQLERFFTTNNPVIVKPFAERDESLGLMSRVNAFISDFSSTAYRLSNNPFQADYPLELEGLPLYGPLQHVKTSSCGRHTWEFGVCYRFSQNGSDKISDTDYSLEYDEEYSGGISSFEATRRGSSHKGIASFDESLEEDPLRKQLFAAVKKDRLSRLFV